MRNKTRLRFAAIPIAACFLLTGFVLGRASHKDYIYGPVSSGTEQRLVGTWAMSADGEPEPWIVEFRTDRTVIRYNSEHEPDVIGTWGIVAGELTIQNAQNKGQTDGYMPPTFFSVTSIDDRIVKLSSADDSVHWKLKRTF